MGIVWSALVSLPRWIRLWWQSPPLQPNRGISAATAATTVSWWRRIMSGGYLPVVARTCHACRAYIVWPLESYYTCNICDDGTHDECQYCHDDKRQGAALARYPCAAAAAAAAEVGGFFLHQETVPSLVDTTRFVQQSFHHSTAKILQATFRLYGPRPCLGERSSGDSRNSEKKNQPTARHDYQWSTYADVGREAQQFGTGLWALLLETHHQQQRPPPPHLVGLWASPSGNPQWFVCDYACALKGLGLVPLHRCMRAASLRHVLQTTALEILVVSIHLQSILQQALLMIEEELEKDNPQALSPPGIIVVWIHDRAEAYPRAAGNSNIDAAAISMDSNPRIRQQYTWSQVMALGAAEPIHVQEWVPAQAPDDAIVKLLPSSGSAGGRPQLTVVTEGTLKRQMHKVLASLPQEQRGRRRRQEQPNVAYAYEVMRQTHDVLLRGGKIGCASSGSLENLSDDCRVLCPTSLTGTAAVWNSLRTDFENQVCQRGSKSENEINTIKQQVLLEWMHRRPLGNRIKVLVSTGSPLPHATLRFLCRVFPGVSLVDAYGTTETGSLAQNGMIVASAEVRLVDRPDLGYTTADQPHARGEIVAQTKTSIAAGGYFDRAKCRNDGTFDAAAVVGSSNDDGDKDWITLGGVRYFRTGDVGERLRSGTIRIIDRCKSHFKLNQGHFVAPLKVEEALLESEWVFQIFAWGMPNMSCVAAVVVPKRHLLKKEHLECEIIDNLRQVGASKELLPWEIPRKVVVEPEPFSQENGMLVAGGKLCRPALIQRYQEQLAGGTTRYVGDEYSAMRSYGTENGAPCAGLAESICMAAAEPSLRPKASDSLISLGLDSLAVARLSSMLQERFDSHLSPRDLFAFSTLADLERVLFSGPTAARRVAVRADVIDWRHEVEKEFGILANDIGQLREQLKRYRDVATKGQTSAPDTILVTGATGFLGAFLLRALLDSSVWKRCRICCLVRAPNMEVASRRLRKNLEWYELCGDIFHRCSMLVGDLASTRLGLSLDDYFDLSRRTKAIFHCGAHVSSIAPYSELREINVVGTRRILELSLLAKAELLHVSTMGFLPIGHSETLDVGEARLALCSGYAQSKWVAEQLVSTAASRLHCRIRVVRPGSIAGDAQSGASNPKDATNMLLLGLVKEGVVSSESSDSPIPHEFNLCPVDFVAGAIAYISEVQWDDYVARFGRNCAFHLCGTESIRLDTLCSWIRAGGYTLQEVSTADFCQSIRKLKTGDHVLFPFKSLLSQPHSGRPRVAQKRQSRLCANQVATAFEISATRHSQNVSQNVSRAGLLKSLEFLMRRSKESVDAYK